MTFFWSAVLLSLYSWKVISFRGKACALIWKKHFSLCCGWLLALSYSPLFSTVSWNDWFTTELAKVSLCGYVCSTLLGLGGGGIWYFGLEWPTYLTVEWLVLFWRDTLSDAYQFFVLLTIEQIPKSLCSSFVGLGFLVCLFVWFCFGVVFFGFVFFFPLLLPTCEYVISFESTAYKLCCS